MYQSPIVMFASEQSKLHEWIYDIVKAVCYDKEYCYRAFAEAFQKVAMAALDAGGTIEGGSHRIYGLKSEYDVLITWQLPRRLNYVGFHGIVLECIVLDKQRDQELERHCARFELSLGEQIPLDVTGNN